ncbi:MAG: hypothetical protein HKN03_17505 [Acidimicrobiales bacterium]|nr:hypothetical protein [Acidimicrobiales bacterium]
MISVFVLVGVLLASTSPASAEPAVSVSTPAGERYIPGQPVALLVEISANRATDGTIRVRLDGTEVVTKNFEVAGGATKTIVVVTDTLIWGGNLVVDVRSSDGNVSVRPPLNHDREAELVAILPSMQGRGIPASTRTSTADRIARTYDISENVLLAGPGAIQMFDGMIGSEQDLSALPQESRAAITQWLAGGGALFLNESTGAAITELEIPASTQSERAVGFGRIVYTDGAVGRGQLDGLIAPTRLMNQDEFGQNFNPGFSGQILLRDAGIAIPGIGVLLILMGIYILAVGPGLFVALRRLHRQPLIWLAIPVVAVVAVGTVYVVGRAQRADVDLAHATIVADTNGVLIERSEILVASSNGGYAGVETGAGFIPGSRTINRFGQQLGMPPEVRDNTIGFDLNPGEVSRLLMERVIPTSGNGSFDIQITDRGDRSLSGTVTNTSGFDLAEVQVVAGNDVVNLGTLLDGETKDLELDDRFAYVPTGNDTLFGQMEQDFFNGFAPDEDDRSPVNAGAFNDFVQRYPNSRAPGQVMALGWTREAPAPVRTNRGREIVKGRTAFVSVVPIEDNDPFVQYGEAFAELQRVFDFELAGQANGQFVEVPMEMHFRLPPNADPAGRYVLEVPNDIIVLEIWDGATFVPSEDRLNAADAGRASTISLEPEEIFNGTVQIRAGFGQFGRSPTPVLRSAAPAEQAVDVEPVIPAVLAGATG